MGFFNGLLSRAPFTVLGMMGLFSIVGNFMTLEENIYQTLEAWRSVTRPIWDFLLGWLFEWIGWEMPWWVKDYLTMGVITTGAFYRGVLAVGDDTYDPALFPQRNILKKNLRSTYNYSILWLQSAMAWPALWFLLFLLNYSLYTSIELQKPKYLESRQGIKTLSKSVNRAIVFLLVLIALNYAFVFSGSPSVAPVIEVCFYLCKSM